MHKISLKLKESKTEPLIYNLKNLNFIFGLVVQEQTNINITFYSQYQIERLLNITDLKKYSLQTFVENFPSENESHYKIGFIFSFSLDEVELINNKLECWFKPKQ